MIERNDFEDFEVSCDHCSYNETVEAPTFLNAVDKIKRDGWRITKVRGDWDHKCPSCVEVEVDDDDYD